MRAVNLCGLQKASALCSRNLKTHIVMKKRVLEATDIWKCLLQNNILAVIAID